MLNENALWRTTQFGQLATDLLHYEAEKRSSAWDEPCQRKD